MCAYYFMAAHYAISLGLMCSPDRTSNLSRKRKTLGSVNPRTMQCLLLAHPFVTPYCIHDFRFPHNAMASLLFSVPGLARALSSLSSSRSCVDFHKRNPNCIIILIIQRFLSRRNLFEILIRDLV